VLHLLLLKRTDLVLFFFFPLFCPLVFFNFIFFQNLGHCTLVCIESGRWEIYNCFSQIKNRRKRGWKIWDSGRFGFGSFIFGLDRFGYKSVRIISGSGLYWVNESSGRFGFGSVHFGLWVKSGQ